MYEIKLLQKLCELFFFVILVEFMIFCLFFVKMKFNFCEELKDGFKKTLAISKKGYSGIGIVQATPMIGNSICFFFRNTTGERLYAGYKFIHMEMSLK